MYTGSLERGRSDLDTAFRKIREPWQIFFDDMICLDCGMAGDERLLPPKCHDEEVVEEQRTCVGIPGTGSIGYSDTSYSDTV